MARENLFIKVGTYTGNATDNRDITGVGFRPDFVLVKGGSNHSFLRTKLMRGDSTSYLATNTANATNLVQEILADGFQIGSSNFVNQDTVAFHYVAIKGLDAQKYFAVGRYYGTGGDDRDYTGGGFSFTPDAVIVKGDTTEYGALATSTMDAGDCGHFAAIANATNIIQNLQANGFQLGTSARTNGSGIECFFAALRQYAGVIKVGTYTGNGVDDREITGVGFQPDVVIVKHDGTNQARLWTSTVSGDESLFMGASAAAADGIQTVSSDGFQVGAAASVNTDAQVYHYIALKAGDFNLPLSRTAVS